MVNVSYLVSYNPNYERFSIFPQDELKTGSFCIRLNHLVLESDLAN